MTVLLLLCLLLPVTASEVQPDILRSMFTFVADSQEMSGSLLTDLESRLEDDPFNITLLTERAALLASMGEMIAAHEGAARVIELEPGKPDGYVLTAALALVEKDFPKAFEYATTAIDLAPDSTDAFTIRILSAMGMGQYQQAYEDCRRIFELEPENADNYNNMAGLEVQFGQYDEAYTHYTLAITLAPDSVRYLCNRGLLLMNVGQAEEALVDFNRAVSLDSTDAHACAVRSRYYLESPFRDVDLALEDLDRAIELEPDNSLRYRQRAAAYYYHLGDFESTIEDMDRAVAADPLDPEVVHARGVFYMEHEDWDSAIADFDRALELDPRYAHVLVNRAMVLFESGSPEGALEDLSEAISMDPTSFARAYYFRAIIYEQIGDLESARADYEACLDMTDDPMLEFYAQSALSRCMQ